MLPEKCHQCKHYILEYVSTYSAYIEGCDAMTLQRQDGCKNAYEPKKKATAIIKRGGERK